MKPMLWALQTRDRFVTVNVIVWTAIGAVAVLVFNLFGPHVGVAELFFGTLAGGVAGLIWANVMWEIFVKPRLRR